MDSCTCVVFFTKPENMTQSCGVLVEPISRGQKLLQESLEVCLKGVLQGWDASSLTQTPTETWVLQASSNEQGAAAFQQLLRQLFGLSLHMVRHPNTAVQFDISLCIICDRYNSVGKMICNENVRCYSKLQIKPYTRYVASFYFISSLLFSPLL